MSSYDTRYPPDWDDRRREVLLRDDYTCQAPNCTKQGGPHGETTLHVHHIQPISQGGSHEYTNLITLCEACHNRQHPHDITEETSSTRSHLATALSTILFMKFLGAVGPALILISVVGTIIIAAGLVATFDIFIGVAGLLVLFVGSLILGVFTIGWIVFMVYSRLASR